MKYTLHLAAVNGGAFNCAPARAIELEDEQIRCNDVTLPRESNFHNVSLWVIGHEFGALCAVWSSEHELLDTAVDLGLMDSFLVEDDHKECEEDMGACDHALLGNASEPFDLTYCWYQRVELVPSRDWQLLCKFAEARGSGADTLYF